MSDLQPLGERVAVESVPDSLRGVSLNAEMGENRIIVPSMYTEPSRMARVVAIGPEVLDVEVGDLVLCNRYPTSAQNFKWQGKTIVTVKESEILAKVGERNAE